MFRLKSTLRRVGFLERPSRRLSHSTIIFIARWPTLPLNSSFSHFNLISIDAMSLFKFLPPLFFFIFSTLSLGAQFAPISVTASATSGSYRSIALINGDGLVGALHGSTFTDQWLAPKSPIPELVFDLGANYSITSADIWNYNALNRYTRGAKDVEILKSDDNVNFTSVANVTLTAASSASQASGNVSFNTNARFIKFKMNSNHGDINNVGLAEVRFNGVPSVPTTVPTLSEWGMLTLSALLALVTLGVMRRRQI